MSKVTNQIGMVVKHNKLFIIPLFILVTVPIVHMYQQHKTLNYYLNIMKDLNKVETKTVLRTKFDINYNFTELYDWVHTKLRFVPFNETMEKRPTDPFEILEYGKGRCGEFSILYVAVCLARGYQSRLIVGIDIGNPLYWNDKHAWAEVKLNDVWVHVDPSDRKWNDLYRYEAWEWGKDLGSTVRIYAFEDGRYEDVTLRYKR